MNDFLVIVVLVVIVLSVTLAYLLGLRLGRERALMDVNTRTVAALRTLSGLWHELDDHQRFRGLLGNMIALHAWVNGGHKVFPIHNLELLMKDEDSS